MKKYFGWLFRTDRLLHVLVGFLVGLSLGIEAAFAAACSAEVKDWLWNGKKGGMLGWVKGNGFDWLDLTATMIGGLLGWGLRLLVI